MIITWLEVLRNSIMAESMLLLQLLAVFWGNQLMWKNGSSREARRQELVTKFKMPVGYGYGQGKWEEKLEALRKPLGPSRPGQARSLGRTNS